MNNETNEEIIKEESINLESDGINWEKQESGVFKFENKGDILIGELINIEKSNTHNNKVYKIRTDEGIVTLFGTTVLDSNMVDVGKGNYIKIVYDGETPHEKKGYSPIKQFSVFKKG